MPGGAGRFGQGGLGQAGRFGLRRAGRGGAGRFGLRAPGAGRRRRAGPASSRPSRSLRGGARSPRRAARLAAAAIETHPRRDPRPPGAPGRRARVPPLARPPSSPRRCAMALALAALAAVEPTCGVGYQQVSGEEPPAGVPAPAPAPASLPAAPGLQPGPWPTRRRGLAGRAGPGRPAGRAGPDPSRPRVGPGRREKPCPRRPGASLGGRVPESEPGPARSPGPGGLGVPFPCAGWRSWGGEGGREMEGNEAERD